jgi:hypothetical protein
MSSYVTLSAISDPSSLSQKISRLVGNAARGAIVSIVDGIFAIGSTMDLPANRRARQVRQVLSSRGLTLYRVSELSAQFFGRSSLYYVPHNLSFDTQDPASIPTFHQKLAISHITGYRLSDWFQVFGFDLDLIPRLHLLVPRKRSTLLDSRVYDSQAWIPWFANRERSIPAPPIAPLGQLLARAAPRRAAELPARGDMKFLYAKVGEEDVYAFPHLAPGSVIRLDPRRTEEVSRDAGLTGEKRLFFVEHDFGYSCSQLVMLAKDRLVLHSPELPCTQIELTLGKEARILGRIDAEIRPATGHAIGRVVTERAVLPRPRSLGSSHLRASLRDLLQSARLRAGLSFREASSMSRWIASFLADELYFAATSTLSDYETLSAPPRHIQKAITLCVLYSIDFVEFLEASGLPLDREGRDPMADELIPREAPDRPSPSRLEAAGQTFVEQPGFLDSLLERWEEVPLFLRHSLDELTGLKSVSLSDLFWVGGDEVPMHPWLARASLVAVNRRIKKPAPAKATFDQPLYLVLARDGSYLCGCCALDEGELVVHLYPGVPLGARRFRNGIDAEVIGQVTAILRRLA